MSLLCLILALAQAHEHRSAHQPIAVLTTDRQIVLIERPNDPPQQFARDIDSIASVATRDGILASRGREILLVPLDGAPPRVMVRHDSTVRFPQPSPNGKLIAYSVEGADGWEVWLADADGSNPRRAAGAFAYGASFCGNRVFFETSEGIVELDTASNKVVPLEAGRGAHSVRGARDGRTIVFARDRAIVLHDLVAGTTRRLTSGEAYDRFPSFDARGERIVFYRNRADAVGHASNQVVELELASGTERIVVPDGALLASYVAPATSRPTTSPR